MKTTEIIALSSLIISIFALLISSYPHITDWKRSRRQSLIYFKNLITSSDWTNEGAINSNSRSSFDLHFMNAPGRSNVYAEMIVSGSESVTLRGKITPKGVMLLTLNITVGWRECPSAEISLVYDEDEDLLTYQFKNYLSQNGLNDDLSRFDFTDQLWRKVEQ